MLIVNEKEKKIFFGILKKKKNIEQKIKTNRNFLWNASLMPAVNRIV